MTNTSRIGTAILAAILSLFSAEAAGQLFFLVHHGQFFYARTITPPINKNFQGTQLIHPYFGFIFKPNTGNGIHRTNGSGFFDPHPSFPVPRQENQVIVGIFGYSVAQGLFLQDQYYHHILEERLSAIPRFAGKEIVILNFSLPGSKQPQSMNILNYYSVLGQQFDLVIYLDGFLEVVNAYNLNATGYNITTPQDYLLIAEMLGGRNVNKVVQEKKKFDLRQKQNQSQTTFAYYGYDYLLHSLEQQETPNPIDETTAETGCYINRSVVEEKQLQDAIASLWSESSKNMNAILKVHKGEFFHFIHPVRYLISSIQWPDSEKKYVQVIRSGYDKLNAKVPSMREEGIHVYDLSLLLTDPNNEFSPDLVHPSENGYKILLDEIARTIVERYAEMDSSVLPSSPSTPVMGQ